jgi:DNA-binding transcriptional regulator GbsR (MarR family)
MAVFTLPPCSGPRRMENELTTTVSEVSAPSVREEGSTKGGSMPVTDALVAESIEFFVSFVQVFGLPRSIGQIYGLLFVSSRPLPMDEVVARLGISKGSASQGLSLLKSLGAVTSRPVPDDRREHFQADLNVSRIVTHFFENRLRPRLENGEHRLSTMLEMTKRLPAAPGDDDSAAVVRTRIEALEKWQRRGRSVLPMIIRWLRP